MKPAEILQRLVDVYAAKSALRRRHVAVACLAGQYSVNNTYQYVIAREDQHLAWIGDAILDMGGAVPPIPPAEVLGPAKSEEAVRGLAGEDARAILAFIAEWRPRFADISNARHRLMLNLMLGEMQEQARLFEQAAAGQLDLLGRRTGGPRTPGSVLPARWVE